MYHFCNYFSRVAVIVILMAAITLAGVATAQAAFGPVVDIAAGTQPHCALGPNGTLHVVFITTAVQYVKVDGGVPSAVETIPGSTSGKNPFISVGTDGSVHVVWDTYSTAYYTNRIGGSWKTPITLPIALPERNYFVQVAVASNGVPFTSHWSLTKGVGGYNVFCRINNPSSATPTATKVYEESADSRPPSIIGPSPASTGDGLIHIYIGLPQNTHRVMDSNGSVTGSVNISKTPPSKTIEGMQGFFIGSDPAIATAWTAGGGANGAVVNTLSRANGGKQAVIAGTGSPEFPYPRAAYCPVRNKAYILYPSSGKPALSSWVPQQESVTQLGNVSESNISGDTRGPGAGGIATCLGGGVHIVYSTGSRVYYRTMDAVEDNQPPSVPTNVQATVQSPVSAKLTWTASTDNLAVAGYKIYRNGTQVATSNTNSYTDSTLQASSTYSFRVSAYDASGNESGQSSPPAVVTTPADNDPPSVPTNVQAIGQSPVSILVTWNASTDNAAVAGYRVIRNGVQIATTAATNFLDSGLAASTTYSYKIAAYDGAGNTSAESAQAVGTTFASDAGKQWIWNADNHSGSSGSYSSLWSDGTHVFTENKTSGGWYWSWDDPVAGQARLVGPGGSNGRSWLQSSSFGEEWDAEVGVTVAARVKPINPSGWGSIMLSINNSSTQGLASAQDPSAKSTHVWVGWDEYYETGNVVFATRSGDKIKDFVPTVAYVNKWSIWTLSGKKIGNTMAWDLWIDGVHQNAVEVASDGTYHTLVWSKSTDMGTSVVIGQRRTQPFVHNTIWDYVSVTNAGVIPGWDGVSPVGGDTIAPSIPTDLAATAVAPTAIKLSWSASSDNVEVTGYRIYRNGVEIDTSEEPSYTDTGLSAETSYSYTVSAFDAAGNDSGQSSPAAVATTMAGLDIAAAKMLADGQSAGFVGKVVTAVFSDSFYIEENDRYAGLKVVPEVVPEGLAGGNKVNLGGVLQTENGERYLSDAYVDIAEGNGSIEPLGLNNKAVGGADWMFNSETGAGQQGINGSVGTNNIGLLVKVWGAYTKVSSSMFRLDDGSGTPLDCVVSDGAELDPNWQYVTAIGISSCYQDGNGLHRLIKIQSGSDITPAASP